MIGYGLWPPTPASQQSHDLQAGVATQFARQQLVSHLADRHGSLERGLEVYDLDADSALTGDELARAASEAGLQRWEVEDVIAFIFRTRWQSQPIATVAERLTGLRAHVSQKQRDARVASQARGLRADSDPIQQQSFASMPSLTNLKEVAQELMAAKAAFKAAMLRVLGSDGILLAAEMREAEAIQIMKASSWQEISEFRDDLDSSALHLAAKDGLEVVCQFIVGLVTSSSSERWAYVNHRNSMGWTALLLAAQRGHSRVSYLLLNAEADANLATQGTGLTPLMLAASAGWADTVRVLLDCRQERPWHARANALLMTSDGRNALELVRARQRSLQSGAQPAPDFGNLRLDSYGVSRPQLAQTSEEFGEVERLLVELTGGVTSYDELHQDIIGQGGVAAPWDSPHEQGRAHSPRWLSADRMWLPPQMSPQHVWIAPTPQWQPQNFTQQMWIPPDSMR